MDIQQEENNGFGPITQPRTKRKQHIFDVVIIFVFLIAAVSIICVQEDVKRMEHVSHLMSVSSSSIFGALVGEFVRRCGLLIEEYDHRRSRYRGSLKKVLSACFVSSDLMYQIILAILSIVCFIYSCVRVNSADVPSMVISFGVTALMVPMLLDLANLYYPTRCEKSFIDESEKKGMADGFAWALYFARLRNILPGFSDRVTESELGRRVTIRKVLLLTPRDCFIPRTVEDDGDGGRINLEGRLPRFVVHQEGFDHPVEQKVYSIMVETGQVVFVAEFPAVVHRLLNMAEHNANANVNGISHDDKEEQVMMFYHSLDNLLQNHAPDCVGNYLLVPYAGRESDLAEVILRAIRNETDGGVQVDA